MKQILPKMELLDNVINFSKKCFSKPQFTHFREYVGGLITLQHKTISSIAAASVEKQNQSSLNRFLTSSSWDEAQLEKRYMKRIGYELNRGRASLIIDDSISKKVGEHIAEAQYHKNHSGDGYIFGHQIVTALVKSKEKMFPLFPKLYSKKTQSKIEFAKELITHASSKLPLKEVIMDSWYMAVEIIKLCLKKRLDVIGCLKSNRYVSFKPGEWIKLSTKFKSLKKRDFQMMIVDDGTFRVYEQIVRIKHVGMVKLLISQEWMCEDKRWSKPFYLISTNTNKSAAQIIRTYAERWSIETFHRDIKQNLGLQACQVRGRKGIIRHLILVALAYAVLRLWMTLQKVRWTIGEIIGYLQGRVFDDLIITIVEENNVVERWKLAKLFISKTARV
jgi:SRSO17 transposase